MHQFGFTEHDGVVHQSGGRLAEHDPARRRHRLHSLRHADLRTYGGVIRTTRTQFTGNDLA